MFKHIQVDGKEPSIEDILREMNRGMWTIGYTGQSPERLRLHMANQHTFDKTTLRANGGPCDGEYYGLPWPCWGTPEMKHPGTANLYDNSHAGGRGRPAPSAPTSGSSAAATTCSPKARTASAPSIRTAIPSSPWRCCKTLGWDADLTAEERAVIEKIGGAHRRSTGRPTSRAASSGSRSSTAAPRSATPRRAAWSGTSRTRCRSTASRCTPRGAIWWQDYPTYEDRKHWRLPSLYASIQQKDFSQDFPIILTSGRLVEYEGGGDETRSNPWLAELQQDMFVEINPYDANDLGVRDGQMVWVHGPEGGKVKVMAMLTERVGRGVAFMPFHFGGQFQGEDRRVQVSRGRRSLRARRVGQHRHDLRLRLGHPDAGNQDHALPGRGGVREMNHGPDEVPV